MRNWIEDAPMSTSILTTLHGSNTRVVHCSSCPLQICLMQLCPQVPEIPSFRALLGPALLNDHMKLWECLSHNKQQTWDSAKNLVTKISWRSLLSWFPLEPQSWRSPRAYIRTFHLEAIDREFESFSALRDVDDFTIAQDEIDRSDQAGSVDFHLPKSIHSLCKTDSHHNARV